MEINLRSNNQLFNVLGRYGIDLSIYTKPKRTFLRITNDISKQELEKRFNSRLIPVP